MMTVFTCDGTEGVVSSGYKGGRVSHHLINLVNETEPSRSLEELEDPRPENGGTNQVKFRLTRQKIPRGCLLELAGDPDM